VAAVLALLLLAGLAYAFLGDRDGSGTVAATPSARGSASSRSSASSTPSSEASSKASSSASASPSDSPSPSTSSSPSPSPRSTPSSPSPSASTGKAELVQSIIDYYAVLPRDTDAGWDRLTKRYRSSTGGRGAYDGFWGSFREVSTSKVSATGDDQVEANIRYVYTDGRRLSERRSFTLVEDDGVLKIDASSVI
jgi:hypothetical protein